MLKVKVNLLLCLIKHHEMKTYLCLIRHHAMKKYWGIRGIASRIVYLGTR